MRSVASPRSSTTSSPTSSTRISASRCFKGDAPVIAARREAGSWSPAGKSPHLHILPPAEPAATHLGIPAGAELIEPFVHGILLAIAAEAAEPLGPVA